MVFLQSLKEHSLNSHLFTALVSSLSLMLGQIKIRYEHYREFVLIVGRITYKQ